MQFTILPFAASAPSLFDGARAMTARPRVQDGRFAGSLQKPTRLSDTREVRLSLGTRSFGITANE